MASEQPKQPAIVTITGSNSPEAELEHNASLDIIEHERLIEAEEVPINELVLAVLPTRSGC
jgi:hypothetical protein